MIYIDTSVALAHLLAEDRAPPPSLWSEILISSRLIEYEVWTRINARNLNSQLGADVRAVLDRISMIELVPQVLKRALEPFPVPVRTLDALHLASVAFLLEQGQVVQLAAYDDRLNACAEAMGIALAPS